MFDAFPPKAEATGSNPVGCTSFPRENAPSPADICKNVQEHARPKLERAYKARSTHTPEHVARVAAILADFPDARTTGLAIAVNELWTRLGCEDPAPEITFVPDAFRLNEEASEIELYEVEVTHPLTTRKLRTLGEWWSAWDAEADHDWLPVLIQVDRFGDRHRRDLGIAYFETLGATA